LKTEGYINAKGAKIMREESIFLNYGREKNFIFGGEGDMFAVPIYQRPLVDIIQYLLNTVPVKD
jgi:hypothetical protein